VSSSAVVFRCNAQSAAYTSDWSRGLLGCDPCNVAEKISTFRRTCCLQLHFIENLDSHVSLSSSRAETCAALPSPIFQSVAKYVSTSKLFTHCDSLWNLLRSWSKNSRPISLNVGGGGYKYLDKHQKNQTYLLQSHLLDSVPKVSEVTTYETNVHNSHVYTSFRTKFHVINIPRYASFDDRRLFLWNFMKS